MTAEAAKAGILILGLMVAGVQARAAEPSVLEEIVVVAQKREQNLQDVPVSVTAFSGFALDKLRFDDAVDLSAQTPGMNVGTPLGEGGNTSVVLRGVGINDFNDNNEGNVAFYIDDVYYSFLAGNTFQLFDIDRVEVLRGPQGTLYGRNASGGLVHYQSRKPTPEFEAWGELSAGNYDLIEFEGAVSGPISERVLGRLAVNRQTQDGYVDNRVGSDRNEKDNWGVRGMLEFVLDQGSVLLNVHGLDSDTVGPTSQAEQTAPFGFLDDDGDPFAGAWDRDTELDIEGSGGSIAVNYDLRDGLALTSITAFDQIERLYQEDTDNSPFDLGRPTFYTDAEQFSQELRLSGETATFNWVVGAYYFDRDDSGTQDLVLGVDAIGVEPPADGSFMLDTEFDQSTTSTALFGQTEWRFHPAWALLLGLRVTDEEKKIDYEQVDAFGGVVGAPSGPIPLFDFDKANVGGLAEKSETITTGKLGLNWTPTDDLLVFASYSRGYKSAGFNTGFVDPTDASGNFDLANIPYDHEILDSYELGLKATVGERRTRFNATVFSYDYQDQQVLTFNGISSFVTNGDSELRGAELEIVTSPVDGLEVLLGASWLDTEVDGVRLSDGSEVLNGVELILSPEYSLNGLIRYAWRVGESNYVTAQLDYSYQDAHYFDITNAPLSREDGYGVLNGSLTLDFGRDDRYSLSLWGKNITDEEYLVYTFDFTGFFGINQNFYGPPPMYGVSLRARY